MSLIFASRSGNSLRSVPARLSAAELAALSPRWVFGFPFLSSSIFWLISGNVPICMRRNRERNQPTVEADQHCTPKIQRGDGAAGSAADSRAGTERRESPLPDGRMSDIIWTADLNLNVTYVSPSLAGVSGFTPEEYGRLPFHERVTPESFDKAMVLLASELEKENMLETDPKRNLRVELEFCHKDGSTVWMESIMNAIRDDREMVGIHGASRDITDRKQAEEALRKSQEQLRDAHRLAHIGVWNWIADTDTVTWTEELSRIAGLDPMIPAPTYAEHHNIYAPESWDRLKVAVEKALETGEPYQLELEQIRPDGATRWVNALAARRTTTMDGLRGFTVRCRTSPSVSGRRKRCVFTVRFWRT